MTAGEVLAAIALLLMVVCLGIGWQAAAVRRQVRAETLALEEENCRTERE